MSEKMTIDEYFDNNKFQEERQVHLDLSSECMKYCLGKNYGDKKVGDLASVAVQMWNAKINLLELLNIKYFKSKKIHSCHKCENDSMTPNGFVCVNPKHIYVGTAKENCNDRNKETK